MNLRLKLKTVGIKVYYRNFDIKMIDLVNLICNVNMTAVSILYSVIYTI